LFSDIEELILTKGILNRVLRRIFRLNKNEAVENRINFSNEELHNVYSSPNIIRMINSRRMR
jgi:hypothetical protein